MDLTMAAVRLRIIPADAGSTLCRSIAGCRSRDHPRGCVEHEDQFFRDLHAEGSSPRMRGALVKKLGALWNTRIIPADAGSTLIWCDAPGIAEDHPRGCGEHLPAARRVQADGGSSPRMRGAPGPSKCTVPPWRIIPADAGSTRQPRCAYRPNGDHPRGCGEHDAGSVQGLVEPGSSPRMRGARLRLGYHTP